MTKQLSTSTAESIMLKLATNTFNGQSDLARKLHVKPQTISKQFKRLIKDGLVEEIPKLFPKQYKITSKGFSQIKHILGMSQRLSTQRLHKVMLVAEIVQQPDKWNLELHTFHQVKKVAFMKNWKTDIRGYHLDNHFMITENSVTFRIKEIYSTSPEQAIFEAMDICGEFLKILMEQNKKLNLKITEGTIRIATLEFALEGDQFAREVIRKGETIITKKFVIDQSKGIPEIDFIDNNTSFDDTRKYANLVQKVIDGDINPEELTTSNIGMIGQALDKLSRLSDMYCRKLDDVVVTKKGGMIPRDRKLMTRGEIKNIVNAARTMYVSSQGRLTKRGIL